jgi:nicotinate-nucleotide--dimethylbenzimidazole phosphoribosyltransferase
MTAGPAMTRAEALRAVATGIDLAGGLWADGVDLLGVGEMGIGNTTAASAICAVLTDRPVALVTGRGTGIDDATHERKIAAIERALEVNSPDRRDPIGVLAAVGGLEIALLVGVIVGAAELRIPVVLDGFITGAAALVAAELQPAVTPRLIAAHRSIEPGHAVILEHLERRPLLDLDLRLGEGTGAALAMGLIAAAVRLRDGMATFESAAISGPTAGGEPDRPAPVGESEPA